MPAIEIHSDKQFRKALDVLIEVAAPFRAAARLKNLFWW